MVVTATARKSDSGEKAKWLTQLMEGLKGCVVREVGVSSNGSSSHTAPLYMPQANINPGNRTIIVY